MKKFIYISTLLLVNFSCSVENSNQNNNLTNESEIEENTISESDSTVSKSTKEEPELPDASFTCFTESLDSIDITKESIADLMNSLSEEQNEESECNIYKIGLIQSEELSEGLSSAAHSYMIANSNTFFSYFDKYEEFNDQILTKWAETVNGELLLIWENENDKIVEEFEQILKENSKSADESIQITRDKFLELIKKDFT